MISIIGFIGILLGMFAIGVMQLVLATALPYIVTEIGGNNLYSWVFTSYMLSSLLTIPIFSKLADDFGKKKFYILGLGMFSVGTIYGGLAPTMSHLIIARVIQGLGAGIITPVSLALISDMFPEDKRGKMIGVFGFVQLLSNLLSPSLGNYITKQLGWQWIFFITVIMVLFAMLLAGIGIKQSKVNSKIRFPEIDIMGGILFGGLCVLIVGFSNAISKHGKFDISVSLLLIGTLVTGFILILNEKHHINPVIKVEFFKTKIIRRSIFSAIVAGAIMYGLITILPLCGIVLSRYDITVDGSQILFFFMIGITLGLVVSSRLTTKLNSVLVIRVLWSAMCVCSMFILYFLSIGNLSMFNVLNIFIGVCIGGITANFLINSQNKVNIEDRTVLSGLIQLARYLGASVGVTVLTSIVPEVKFISSITQFLGAFGLLVVFSLVGLVNEIV